MKRMATYSAILLLGACLTAAEGTRLSLRLRDGSMVEGEALEDTPQEVLLLRADGRIQSIPAADIVSRVALKSQLEDQSVPETSSRVPPSGSAVGVAPTAEPQLPSAPDHVRITLQDGTQLTGTVVGSEIEYGVALLLEDGHFRSIPRGDILAREKVPPPPPSPETSALASQIKREHRLATWEELRSTPEGRKLIQGSIAQLRQSKDVNPTATDAQLEEFVKGSLLMSGAIALPPEAMDGAARRSADAVRQKGANSQEAARALEEQGQLLMQQRRVTEAIDVLRKSQDAYQRAGRTGYPDWDVTRDLAVALYQSCRDGEAAELLKKLAGVGFGGREYYTLLYADTIRRMGRAAEADALESQFASQGGIVTNKTMIEQLAQQRQCG